jgi:hemolysin III
LTHLDVHLEHPISSHMSREQSPGEEIANGVSHGIGLLASIVAAPILIVSAVRRDDPVGVVAVSVFSASMILLYLASTSYHVLPAGRLKRVAQRFDHAAIYLLIAGTYTPFTLGVLRGPWGWTLFGLVWGLALIGLLQEGIINQRVRILSVCIYLAMGWLALIAVRPIWLTVPRAGFFWILAGGLVYTVGIVFYAANHIRYAHFAWHLCVLAGSACFFVAVFWYSF